MISQAVLTNAAKANPVDSVTREKKSSPAPDVVSSDSKVVVETESGKIRGFNRKGIFAFKGVPYGASTSGLNRFMAPAKAIPWIGIRNALQYGRACFQAGSDSQHFDYDGMNLALADEDAFLLHRGRCIRVAGEDCLRLNVWTPEINGHGRRPVMVFMHGGGYEGGFDNDLLSYDGENLARNDVVVVTHNHRLNVFGYLNLSELGGERYADSANTGLLDLVRCLQWVHDNIANFGGDPGNVSIFGQSGGGGKVMCLMAMPSAKGLFHRAAIQSGPFLRGLTPEYSAKVAAGTLQELGLGKGSVDQLQHIPVDRLSGASTEAMKKYGQGLPRAFLRDYDRVGWGPTVDGRILPRHPFDPAGPIESADVPLLTGSVLHEIISALDNPTAESMTTGDLMKKMREAFGDRGSAIVQAYRREYPAASPFGLYAAISAEPFRRCAFEQASRKAALGAASAYAYLYSWRTPALDDRVGTFHACDISFVFDNAEICDQYSGRLPEALKLAKQVSGAWVNFARSGNPNHAGLPHWPAFTPEQRATMVFDTTCTVRNRPESEGLSLIAKSS
jgi:para-nitrobenzyl esterase